MLAHPLARSALVDSQLGRALQNAESDELSSAVALFKEDGQQGRHGPEWVSQAIAANNTRRVRGFQEYENAKFQQHFASASRELSDEEEDKAVKTGKGGNGGNGSCNADKKHHNHKFDNDGDDDMAGGKPFSCGPLSSRTGNGFSSDNSNNPRSNSGNGGNDNSNNSRSDGKNVLTCHTRYDFSISPSSDIVNNSYGAHFDHLRNPLYHFAPFISFPCPAIVPVLRLNPQYGMVDLVLQAEDHGLNDGQTRIAINNACSPTTRRQRRL